MDQLIEFAGNHFLLVTSFFFVLTLLIVNLLQDSGGFVLTPQQAVGFMNAEGAIAIDMRSAADFETGHIINAEHFEAAELKPDKEKISALKDKPLLIYCTSGVNSAAVVRQLKRAGFAEARSLKGGINAWRSENLPTAKA